VLVVVVVVVVVEDPSHMGMNRLDLELGTTLGSMDGEVELGKPLI